MFQTSLAEATGTGKGFRREIWSRDKEPACAAPRVLAFLAGLGSAIITYMIHSYQGAWVSIIQTCISFAANFLSSILL